MNTNEIIEKYNATGVVITNDFVEWIRSDHAGETGAVWIYKGASLAFWSQKIRCMALSMAKQKSNTYWLWIICSLFQKGRN